MATLPSIHDARRIVLKIGSSLMAEDARLRAEWLAAMAGDIAKLHQAGKEVIIVSSGAVALGRPRVGLGSGTLSLEEKQAAAAAGQPLLIQAWQRAFDAHGINVAQLLLTLEDSERRRRYLNARTTFQTLLEHKLIPIVNENDTVATAELKFGDNDRLAARVAGMISADLLVLFSDVDGLYTKHPGLHKDAQHIPELHAITPDIMAMAGGAASALSNGGMKTKLEAAQMAMSAGCNMVIAQGAPLNALSGLGQGARATWFIASTKPQLARKHWIAAAIELTGAVMLDEGAVNALRQGKSLLPAGVTTVEGTFMRGDTVGIKAPNGTLVAKGIIAYNAQEVTAIKGKKTDAIASILGYAHHDCLIHRDDLVIL
mgnify:CR=1 FL=1